MNNKPKPWQCLCLLTAFFLSGCGQQSSSIIETTKLAMVGQPDTEISAQQVAKIPYASAYLKIGDAPRAFVVLGFANADHLKWFTADRNMLVTRTGRVIKTLGFGNDLLFSDSALSDPLSDGKTLLKQNSSPTWQHREVWSGKYQSGYTLTSTFSNMGVDAVTVLDTPRKLVRIDEKVQIPALKTGYTNSFWLDPDSGDVVQSYQYLGPDLPLVQFTTLKPYASGRTS
jgi:hypothetical protein